MVTELFGATGPNVADPVLDRLRRATLGSYDIAGELGRGGMAIVYVARDMKLERTVAIKVMDPRLSLAHGMAERFLQEARIAARLQHPNIIVVHDIRQSDELIFFVMGLIEGGALDELCQHGQALPIEQVRWILLQASRALAFAHAEGITHRDVKPANILVNLKGDVILTDFGIAKAVGGDSMTKSGTQIGTPTYMSPEQFGDTPTGPATDQYALGVTAYQLLTGKTPFSGDLYQLVAAHISASPAPLRDLRPDCPAFLANAVMRMLEKKPEGRWPSLEDLEGVFGANMPMDGGAPRKTLAQSAQQLHKQRASTVAALTAKVPMSPTPTNAARARMETPLPELARVSISPPGATIFVRGTLELKASVTSESGDPVAGVRILWTSSDTGVVTITPDGVLEGVAPGLAVVRAMAADTFEEATIRVERAPLARVTVTNPKITLKTGELARAEVAAIDVNGVQRSDVSFSWISRSPSIAQIDGPGNIRGVTPGDAIVEVSVGNVRRLIEVSVQRRPVTTIRIQPIERTMELGDARALIAIATDDQGTAALHPSIHWSSSQPSAIHVDSAGTALAIGPGVSQITASVDDVSDSVELESVEPPIGAIEVVLTRSTIEIGNVTAVEVRVKDTTGAPRSANGVRVWSSAPSIAEFDANTMSVTALAVGTLHIQAETEASANRLEATSAVLTVTEVAVARILVQPESLDLELGAVSALAVHCLDARGRAVMTVKAVAECVTPGIAVVEGGTAVRGLAAGATELRVFVTNPDGQSVETRVPVRVRKARLARFAINTPRHTLNAGDSINLTVSAWDTMGDTIADVSPAWHSSDPSIAEVDAEGRVTATRAGKLTLTAEVGGRSEQIQLVVSAAPLARLSIEQPANELLVGVPVRLVISATDIHGVAVTPAVRWTVQPVDAAHIQGNEFTALQAVVISVRAALADDAGSTSTGVREATVSLRAREPRIESVTVEPTVLTLKPGERRRIAARVKLEGGREPATNQITWSSSNTGVVTVDTSGELSGVSVGECVVEASVDGKRAASQVTVRASAFAGASARIPLMATAGLGAMVLAWLLWPGGDNSPATLPVQPPAASAPAINAPPAPTAGTTPVAPPDVPPSTESAVAAATSRPRQLTSLRVTGADSALLVGTTQRLSVAFLDEQRTPMTGNQPRVRWSSSDASAVSVSADGMVTVRADRSATISARAGDVVGTLAVRGKKPAPVVAQAVTSVAAPVVRSALEEFGAVTGAFDRNPTDRWVARTTLQKIDSLESLLPPNTEQARAAFYMGRAHAALDQKDGACTALSRAKTLRASAALTTQIDILRRDEGCIAAPAVESRPVPTTPAGRSQTELKAELDTAIYRYARAFESRDVNRVRAAFPGIPVGKLEGYRNMFRLAREISITVANIAATSGALSESVGSVASATASVVVRIRTGETAESRTEWKARLQRTASGWQIIAME